MNRRLFETAGDAMRRSPKSFLETRFPSRSSLKTYVSIYKHFYPGGQGERVEKRDSRKANGGMALGRHALPGWERAFLEEQARQGAGFAEILHLLIEFRENFSLTCISHFFILNWLKKRLVINASTYFRRIGEHLT
jgi:hypothetical protein